MSYRTIQFHANKSHQREVKEILIDPSIIDKWLIFENDDRQSYELLVRASDTQKLMDKIQTFLGAEVPENTLGVQQQHHARVIVSAVQAVWPRNDEEEKKNSSNFTGLSREELYSEISKGIDQNTTYFALIVLSTIVAAIGMINNDTAVIIGAMVIAPLLAPNLALALATTLADVPLMWKAIWSNFSGLAIVIALGALVGHLLPTDFSSEAITTRTSVNYEGMVLAIAAGAAGVLSLTAGVSSILVGVMVAVALLPPATAVGITLGAEQYSMAAGASLLLAVNIVCINLAAKVVFLLKGIRPLQWGERKKAKKAMFWYLFMWTTTLVILGVLIHYSKELSHL